MSKKGMVFCLVLMSMLAAGAALAGEAAAPGSSPTLLPLLNTSQEAPGFCKAAPLSKAQVPAPPVGLFAESTAGDSEACSPAECGSGASQQQCSSSCCRNKCCIC